MQNKNAIVCYYLQRLIISAMYQTLNSERARHEATDNPPIERVTRIAFNVH